MPDFISSRRNGIIKEAVQLSGSAECRRERRLYFLEGARLCSDAAASGVSIQILFYTEHADEKYAEYLSSVRKCARASYVVAPQVAQALSCTKTSQEIFCVCEMPLKKKALTDRSALLQPGAYIALEELQNPANLGAVLRTAEALGVDGAVLGGNCCDLYSPKVLRASMGAVFRLPIYDAEDLPALLKSLNRRGFLTAAAVPDAAATPITRMNFSGPCMLAVGNEGNGLSEETKKACSVLATIPMTGRAESLNASAAAAILIWEMMRRKSGDVSQ